MLEKTIQEFVTNAETLVIGAVVNDDFVKIKTEKGNAVLVNEAEWDILIDAMKTVIAQATK